MITQKIEIFGKVQGVYFRSSAKQQADLIGVRGRVKNQQDGSVLMEIEGETAAVQKMIHWCHGGPALARVSEIKKQSSEPRNFSSFEIER